MTVYNHITTATRKVQLIASYRQFEMRAVRFSGTDPLADDSSVIALMHDGLMWMYQSAFNPTAQNIVIDSFAALPSAPDPSRLEYDVWIREMVDVMNTRLQNQLMSSDNGAQSLVEVERSVRALGTLLYHRGSTNQSLAETIPEVIKTMETTISALTERFDPSTELRARLDVACSIAFPAGWQHWGIDLFSTHVFQFHPGFELPLSTWHVRASVQVPVLSTVADFSFLTCLHRMPYDTHVTGLNANNIPVLQTMTAYIHAALKAHFQGLTTNPLNPLLTADNIAYMSVLCKRDFYPSAELSNELNADVQADRRHSLAAYESELRALYRRSQSEMIWHRNFHG
ncbi:hypothetical protein HDZ31DRAFT_76494 [Schizophyllum fasciatum]